MQLPALRRACLFGLIPSHYKYLLPRRAKVACETEAGTDLSSVWLSSNWTVLTQER
ncbi:unnamed protein product [Rhodiola kirilowii]